MSKNLSKTATEGQRIKYVRELMKLSLTDFAKPLGKHLSAIQKWETNGRKLDKSNLLLLEKIWSINPDFIQSGYGDPFIKTCSEEPATCFIYDILGKRHSEHLNLKESAPVEIMLHEPCKSVSNMLFIKAVSSEIPGISKGDIVGIELGTETADTEDRYLVSIQGYIALKYLCFLDGSIVSVENSAKSSIKLSLKLVKSSEISILGRVATIRREL